MDNFGKLVGWVLHGLLVVAALWVALLLGGIAFIFGDTLASTTTGVIAGTVVAAMSGVWTYRMGMRFWGWVER